MRFSVDGLRISVEGPYEQSIATKHMSEVILKISGTGQFDLTFQSE